ncbi:DUF3592 domain-containing protein [Actinomadura kijaniata]|uniref:DUF3592 domain-containing protein n=1 Tax=Actinomadura kijaniata TaxID=46161 RepID=UPI003F1994FF
MPATRSPRYRPLYVLCITVTCVIGTLTAIYGGSAVLAWIQDLGMARATAEVLEVEETGSRYATVRFEFTTSDGRTVRSSAMRRFFDPRAKVGSRVDVLYEPERPASSVRYDQKPAETLPWCGAAAVVTALLGVAAYRTRPGT